MGSTDREMMARALQLAAKGCYTTSPNPSVGCVITLDGAIVAEGYTRPAGGNHAEIEALQSAGNIAGATAYVTLEPCSHQGKTGPCADALIAAGIARVVIAGEDPNWGRIVMAIGKAGPKINLKKLSIKFGDLKIVEDGKLHQNYDEKKTSLYMKNENIDFDIEIFTGTKSFTVYTMDFTKKYIDINADYRS